MAIVDTEDDLTGVCVLDVVEGTATRTLIDAVDVHAHPNIGVLRALEVRLSLTIL